MGFVGAYYYVCMAHGTKAHARGVPRGYPLALAFSAFADPPNGRKYPEPDEIGIDK
jgi:hypothetical protein